MTSESAPKLPTMGTDKSVLVHLPKCKPVDITFKDITFHVDSGFIRKKRKEVLKGVSGKFYSGELTAIMGPSGAGKSTLLNILSGFQKEGMSGKILSNGLAAKKGSKECGLNNKETCYILQDDQLCPLFTVSEIMSMACDLKLGNHLSRKEKRLVIEDILDTIGLGSTKNTHCGQLSGGQKKRLSIALELIDNPAVMFLDEPTTGLDSASTFHLVNLLKCLARSGRTVVCTIHQPSATIFEMFDHMYIISDGSCVYQGTSTNVVPFLLTIGLTCPQYHNPSDFMLDVVTGEFGDYTQQLMDSSRTNSWRAPPPAKIAYMNGKNGNWDTEEVFTRIKPPSEWVKLKVLLHRCTIQLYRDWTVTHLKIFLHFCVGMLLGYNFVNCGVDGNKSINNVGYFMCTTVYLSYTSIMPAILKFPSELHIIRKEQFNNWYKLRTYYLAFLATNLPVQVMLCTTYVVVSYYLSTQILDWKRFLMFLLINQLSVIISECMGLALGTTTNPTNGLFIGCILFCLFLLFAGFLALFKHMPIILQYVAYFSFMKYTVEGMVMAVYGFNRPALDCPDNINYCHYRTSKAIFEEIGMENGNYSRNVIALCVIFVITSIYAYVSLRNKLKCR
uniref:ABC transporter domain-containing protein n=1 Tax=Clastoptera arizonana TaxID=38151 RepID=A0A1B6DHE5_9HEMI